MHHIEGTFCVVQCQECGMIYLNPRPSDNALKVYYPESDYYSYRSRGLAKSGGGVRRAKDAIRAIVCAIHLGYDDEAPAWIPRRGLLRPLLGLASSPFKDRVARYLPPHAWGRSLLDVGCGAGHCLDHGREFGWETCGVEISESAVAAARSRGHDVSLGDLEQARYESSSFDVVRLWHTLEHLPNPRRTLSEVHRILKPGGRLWLEVPNVSSAPAAVFRARWFGLDVPRHLQSFSPRVLKSMLREAGFEEISMSTYQSAPELENSTRYLLEDAGIRFLTKGPVGRVLKLLGLPFWTVGAWLLTWLGLGDKLRATAMKT